MCAASEEDDNAALLASDGVEVAAALASVLDLEFAVPAIRETTVAAARERRTRCRTSWRSQNDQLSVAPAWPGPTIGVIRSASTGPSS